MYQSRYIFAAELCEVFVLRNRVLKNYLRRISPAKKRAICGASVFSALLVFFIVSYVRAVPVAVMTMETVSKGDIEKTVVASAERAISENESGLFSMVTNSSGEIVSLEADVNAINALTSNVVSYIHDDIKKMGNIKIPVPLGSTLGGRLFYGMGPNIIVRATPYVAAYAHIESSFVEAGINQTLHRMTMTVSTEVTVICAGKTVTFNTESQITVSEEIIIGKVPSGVIR